MNPISCGRMAAGIFMLGRGEADGCLWGKYVGFGRDGGDFLILAWCYKNMKKVGFCF